MRRGEAREGETHWNEKTRIDYTRFSTLLSSLSLLTLFSLALLHSLFLRSLFLLLLLEILPTTSHSLLQLQSSAFFPLLAAAASTSSGVSAGAAAAEEGETPTRTRCAARSTETDETPGVASSTRRTAASQPEQAMSTRSSTTAASVVVVVGAFSCVFRFRVGRGGVFFPFERQRREGGERARRVSLLSSSSGDDGAKGTSRFSRLPVASAFREARAKRDNRGRSSKERERAGWSRLALAKHEGFDRCLPLSRSFLFLFSFSSSLSFESWSWLTVIRGSLLRWSLERRGGARCKRGARRSEERNEGDARQEGSKSSNLFLLDNDNDVLDTLPSRHVPFPIRAGRELSSLLFAPLSDHARAIFRVPPLRLRPAGECFACDRGS